MLPGGFAKVVFKVIEKAPPPPWISRESPLSIHVSVIIG